MPIYHHDQMKRTVELPAVPKRIVSLVPSQTELLFDLGLDAEIIGITKFCVHPAGKVKQRTKIGGTKTLNINLIKKLQPDLIIGNKEENERSQIEELMHLFPVWMSDINDLDSSLDMIKRVGEMMGKGAASANLANRIQAGFNGLKLKSGSLRVAYMIWRKPFIVAGKDTFIDDMLQRCGLTNAFKEERYPEVTNAQLIETKPDVVFLSSEPYPFKERHIEEFKTLIPDTAIKLVDGEMFSWYGSRLLQAPGYFEKLNELIRLV